MKKLYSLIALVGFLFAFEGAALAVDSPANVGEIKRARGAGQATPSRVYKLVRYAEQDNDTASISSGAAVIYDTVSDDGVTIALSTTQGDGRFAGIAVTTIQTSDNATAATAGDDAGGRNWGYIQVHGPVSATITSGATYAVGEGLYQSSDSAVVGNLDNATVDNSGRGGFFQDACGPSATSCDVFLLLE